MLGPGALCLLGSWGIRVRSIMVIRVRVDRVRSIRVVSVGLILEKMRITIFLVKIDDDSSNDSF